MPAQKNNITKGNIPFTALVLFSNMKKKISKFFVAALSKKSENFYRMMLI